MKGLKFAGVAVFGFAASLACAAGDSALAATYNYIPASIALSNVNTPSGGKVCVIGSSMQLVGKGGGPTIAPYYLAANNSKQGIWTPVGATQSSVTGLELGKDITSIVPSPSTTQPYLNAGSVRFYVIKNNSSFNCASISYTYTNTGTGDLELTYYPYPSGLLEMSAYAKANLPNAGDTSNVLTIDTSNVDNFQIPLAIKVQKGTTALATIGNPVTSTLVSRKTMISGRSDLGGAQSPFVTWLRKQPGYADGPKHFERLALSSRGWNEAAPSSSTAGSYPFAMIQSPTDYLAFKCLDTGNGYVPAGCNLNGLLVHARDPLNSYYEKELRLFFQTAYPRAGVRTEPLVVMGDAQGKIAQLPWTVSSNRANCPVYLKPDGRSLQFKSSYGTPIVICNPIGQIVPLRGGAPIQYTQTPDTVGVMSTATIQITQAQYNNYKNKVGWNFGQPETGWIGYITSIYQQNGSYFIALNVVGTPVSPSDQVFCTVTGPSGGQPSCPKANTSFTSWVFTNIKRGSSIDPFETPTEMVFGNDGAFSSWLYYTDTDLMTVVQSIERNIVWAFTHGIANCNNATMNNAKVRPAVCANVKKLASRSYNAGAFTASDAYWSNEANWYPADGVQNYYAQYLHTARLDGATGAVVPGASCPGNCFNIFLTPASLSKGVVAHSQQGIPMGMAYGFGYDENPVYLTVPVAQVPSKLDPIPMSWGTGLTATVTVGRSW